MLTRRRFVEYSVLSSSMLAVPALLRSGWAQTSSDSAQRPLRLAVLGSTYRRGSNMQTIADRFLVGYPFEGDWHMPSVQVASMYVDEQSRRAALAPTEFDRSETGSTRRGPIDATSTGDLSTARAKQFGFRLCRNIPEALRCGGDHIAVDAVLTIIEQCDDLPYPTNSKGQVLLPRYDFFQQCVQVFEAEKHAVPYFNHKQLSFSFAEAQSMVKTADRLQFPLMAGSSIAVTWRLPDVDIPFGAPVQEAVMVGVGGFDGMDFDALEAMQSTLERRKGAETGVKTVQLLEGDDVWIAHNQGRWSRDLLTSALSRSDTPQGLTLLDGRTQDLVSSGVLPQLVKDPAAYCIEYVDGTRAALLILNGAIKDFNIAAQLGGQDLVSTQFFMSPAPSETYSACLARKIEQMYQTKSAPYSVERTLLVTGLLEACLNSRHRQNQKLQTSHLGLTYKPPIESQYVRT
jgi:hypothetical protein